MQMEPQVSLDCGACLRSNNIFHKDGTSGVNITSPAQDHVSPQQPGTYNFSLFIYIIYLRN